MESDEDRGTIKALKIEYATVKEKYCSLRKDIEDNLKENKELQRSIEEYEQQKFGMRSCQNCNEKFSPLQNEDVASNSCSK